MSRIFSADYSTESQQEVFLNDLVLIANLAVEGPVPRGFRAPASGAADFAGLTGSVLRSSLHH